MLMSLLNMRSEIKVLGSESKVFEGHQELTQHGCNTTKKDPRELFYQIILAGAKGLGDGDMATKWRLIYLHHLF